jgi:cytochrome b subunit of formate dehydrogenase
MSARAVFFTATIVLALLGLTGPAFATEMACTDCHDLDLGAIAASVHGPLDCTDCHADATELPHAGEIAPADCSACHGEIALELDASIHGSSLAKRGAPVPTCQSCHGDAHTLLPVEDPESAVHNGRQSVACGSCHANPEMAEVYRLHRVQPIEAYSVSVHARAILEGREAADCTSCHGSHGIFPAGDPRSTVYHYRVPGTCGQCHGKIADTYAGSIHGQAAAMGIRESPVCTDCHGEHRILSPQERGSPVYASNIPRRTCGHCHGDLRLGEKFGIPPDKVPAYEDSYHGLAMRSGVATVAHCGSCHGIHDILPSSDPRSAIHPDNVPQTCGNCHPGAEEMASIGPVHVIPSQPDYALVFYIREIYIWLIYLTVGAMLLHNGLDFLRKLIHPPVLPPGKVATRERMSPGFRVAHALMAVSFATLVYTGFALTYPEAWWARHLLHWEESIGLRGYLHRAAAVVMMLSLVVHLIHLAVDRRARACIASMRPTLHDWHEFVERVRYFLGRRQTPPPAEALGYPEKMEYIALMWGSLVMVVTGLTLWFENWTLRWLPAWAPDVSTVIHFYEAILASLAILVWHFYFVIFDPVVYPMDKAWLTGRSAVGRALERGELSSAKEERSVAAEEGGTSAVEEDRSSVAAEDGSPAAEEDRSSAASVV